MKFVLKKKKVLKTKTNLHSHQKISKGKKKKKEKKNEINNVVYIPLIGCLFQQCVFIFIFKQVVFLFLTVS